MCTGHGYRLFCTHTLIHISSRCPSNCGIPSVSLLYLDDCCAPCHKKSNIDEIMKQHGAATDALYKELQLAKGRGDGAEVDAVNEKVLKQLDESSKLFQMSARMGGGMRRVIWPGKGKEEE